MSTLRAVRTLPVRAAVRLQTMQGGEREAGMTTAEYAVGTMTASGMSVLTQAGYDAQQTAPPLGENE